MNKKIILCDSWSGFPVRHAHYCIQYVKQCTLYSLYLYCNTLIQQVETQMFCFQLTHLEKAETQPQPKYCFIRAFG